MSLKLNSRDRPKPSSGGVSRSSSDDSEGCYKLVMVGPPSPFSFIGLHQERSYFNYRLVIQEWVNHAFLTSFLMTPALTILFPPLELTSEPERLSSITRRSRSRCGTLEVSRGTDRSWPAATGERWVSS